MPVPRNPSTPPIVLATATGLSVAAVRQVMKASAQVPSAFVVPASHAAGRSVGELDIVVLRGARGGVKQIGQVASRTEAKVQGTGVATAAAGIGTAVTIAAFCRGGRPERSRRTPSVLLRAQADDAKAVDAPPKQGSPLKVAIAGGGVGGLTTALAMLKQGFDVTVYEKTGGFARFGGPIQFASNALSTLKAIDERLFQRVMDKFTFTATRRCGIKDGFRSDGSFRMTNVLDPTYLFNKDVPADWFVSFPLKECADVFNLPYTGVINRPDLQDILLDECRQMKPDFIKNASPVVGYENLDAGVRVKLADGTTAEADVLVGSDGIWSAVRSQMYDEGPIKQAADDGWSRQGCPYSGYTVFAGETVMKLNDYYECGYKVYIGPQRYFVTSDVGDGRIQWYAFCALPPGTKKAGDTWEGSSSSSEEGKDVIAYLKSLHQGWCSEVFTVLENTPAESVEQRDLYDRWPEFLRSWADGNVILVGDAVHPMMPNLGQGGCQAIEDAYELTRALVAVQTYSNNVVSSHDYQEALQEFYRRRVLRVAGVSLLSRLASSLIINAFSTPWSPHDDKGQDWKSYLTFCWKPLLQYLIFPAQFLFLYSYHPTGGMGSLPQSLERDWRAKHKVASEAAFERVAREGQSSSGPSFFAAVEGASAA